MKFDSNCVLSEWVVWFLCDFIFIGKRLFILKNVGYKFWIGVYVIL